MLEFIHSYETLRIIWWLLLGTLLAGFAITDGFDLGVACLLPFIAHNDDQRRILINSVAPVWEGNQVWLILGAGAIFAAWPSLYAVSFSGFFWAMLAALAALILRPVAFKYRSKVQNATWRQTWDILLAVSGIVPAVIFGLAMGNAMQGVPFHFDADLQLYYTGSFWQLLNPFALLCGVLSLCMLVTHGAIYLCIKTEDPLQYRARAVAQKATWLCLGLFILGGLYNFTSLNGYILLQEMAHDGPSNPLHKEAQTLLGAWLLNYSRYHWMKTIPAVALGSLLLTALLTQLRWFVCAFASSSLSLLAIIFTVGFSMFPFLLPSSSHPDHSLTVWDASSSQSTLKIMLWATLIFLPIVLTYTSWAYRVVSGKVTRKFLQDETSAY